MLACSKHCPCNDYHQVLSTPLSTIAIWLDFMDMQDALERASMLDAEHKNK